MKKLAIAYRIYPKISKVPAAFAHDKLKLSELCLRSFVNSMEGVNYKMWALLDGCPEEYVRLFEAIVPKERLEIVMYPGIGNGQTFSKQIEILTNQNFSDDIYFAEDDYFYLPKAMRTALNFFHGPADPDFITLFDHLDLYTLELHNYKSKIYLGEGYHWREVGSTCLTFLTNKKNLQENKKMFLSFVRKNHDVVIWLSLTKKKVRDLDLYFILPLKNKAFRYIPLKILRFTLLEILFGKKWKLMSPIPGLALHMESTTISPNIDWDSEFNKIELTFSNAK